MMRERLPNRRRSQIIAFKHAELEYVASVSRFADGRPAEIFLDGDKPGSPIDIMAKDLAVVVSMALQHGTPVAEIRAALSQERSGHMLGPLGVLFSLMDPVAP